MLSKIFNLRLILWAAIFSLPIFLLVLLSLTNQWRFPDIIPHQLSLNNWKDLLLNQNGMLQSFEISLFISTVVGIASTTAGFLMSRSIAFHSRKNIFIAFAYLPFVLSPVIFASVLNFYFISIDLSGNIAGVMLAQLLITLPFSILLFVDYWDNKLKSLEDLVLTLGGNSQQAFSKVLIPVSKNILLLCFFQTFIISWFDYGLTSLIGVGKIATLNVKVFQFIGEANPYYAAVSSCLLIIPPVILLFINKKYLFNQLR